MTGNTCPQSAKDVLDKSFLENRARLLEIAAFLDRLDRSAGADEAMRDYRYLSLRRALAMLATPQADRVKNIQLSLSDPTDQPLARADGLKGATGAWKGVAGATD